jgi:hypothetical protein
MEVTANHAYRCGDLNGAESLGGRSWLALTSEDGGPPARDS